MTGKERAAFRAQANHLEPLFQVGKGGMSDALIKQTDDALSLPVISLTPYIKLLVIFSVIL